MLEVEVKARVGGLEEARRRAAAMGGARLGAAEQRDTYYAHPCRDFAARDEALRVREAAGLAELTYKGPKLDPGTKTRREATVRVAGAAEARAVLEALGFRPVAEVRKRRERWRVGEAVVALDDVEGLGAFVEVELEARGEAEARALGERALALLRDLGGRERIRESYLELLLAARGKP